MTRDQAAKVVAGLFEESYHSLTRYACRRTGNLPIAEELVQDVLMDLFAELRRGGKVDHPKAWSLVVLQRKISRYQRKAHGVFELSLDDASRLEDANAISQVERMQSDGEAREVSTLFSHLTEREQAVMLLRMESLKYREIAKVLGISKNTVNALLARGLGKLRALVQRKELEGALPPRASEKKSATTLQ
jgi:RNA polymerase sigma factor (sigma-70 family)